MGRRRRAHRRRHGAEPLSRSAGSATLWDTLGRRLLTAAKRTVLPARRCEQAARGL